MNFSTSTQLIPKELKKKLYKSHETPSYQHVTSLNEIVTREDLSPCCCPYLEGDPPGSLNNPDILLRERHGTITS
jgi:hypothetical protein